MLTWSFTVIWTSSIPMLCSAEPSDCIWPIGMDSLIFVLRRFLLNMSASLVVMSLLMHSFSVFTFTLLYKLRQRCEALIRERHTVARWEMSGKCLISSLSFVKFPLVIHISCKILMLYSTSWWIISELDDLAKGRVGEPPAGHSYTLQPRETTHISSLGDHQGSCGSADREWLHYWCVLVFLKG